MNGQALDDELGQKLQGKATSPIRSAITITVVVSTPAVPNTAILTTPMPSDTAASVAITAAPSSPAAISSDSMITPVPVVAPTTMPHPAAAAA